MTQLRNRHRPARVTAARLEAGMNQAQLAEKLSCSISLISEIESGRKNVTPERLALMAEVLRVEIADLASEVYLAEMEDAA